MVKILASKKLQAGDLEKIYLGLSTSELEQQRVRKGSGADGFLFSLSGKRKTHCLCSE